MKKTGFTLVELSIVLVIIGLLVGGILVAQSMIDTARMESAVRQIQNMDTAIRNFQTKYNSLPGDAVGFGGDGNGQLNRDPASNGGSYVLDFSGEAANFWIDLQLSGFMADKAKFSSVIPSGGYNTDTAAPNSPAMNFGKNTAVVLSENATAAGYGQELYYSYTLGAYKGEKIKPGFSYFFTAFGYYPPAFTSAEALSLDKKIDDGNPALGIVNTGASAEISDRNGCDNFSVFTDAGAAVAKYTPENKGILCFLSVGILGQPLARAVAI